MMMVVVVVREILIRCLQMVCLSRGSTPTVGSSRMRSSGSWSRATARLALLRISFTELPHLLMMERSFREIKEDEKS